ncbi:hypothetical protein C0V72_02950 [Porphyrobacter sp. TH134]|uniref:hypothetical protein n=1 Tax=Porphyrobacter sp. TH134 TaxID=2067450 RepID=UPI000C7CDD7D|nr:hypothetical protein [Porphyrobacter sp. TH134]PLK24984.1 hypothetical protein C0V72_02950 [Porphyrobacter sp. TH134]
MIEIIPWMLVLVWWDPKEPGRFEVQREPHLYADEATCQLYGNERVAGVKMYDYEHGYVKVTYKCLPVPKSEEFDRLYADIDEERREAQAAEAAQSATPSPGEGQ